MAKKSRDLSDLYRIASDPKSTPKALKEVWEETKSSKVRRAVASNLNCDKNTMKMAARLYLKDVLNNPSLEILKLFTDDEFIARMFEAYEKPDMFAKSKHVRGNSSDRELFIRTMLLSPQLSSKPALDAIFSGLNTTVIKRELKDEEVRSRVRKIAMGGSGLAPHNSSIVLDLYSTGVIDLTEFENYLSSCSPGSIHECGSGSIKRLMESQLEKLSAENYSLVFKLMVSCSTRSVRRSIASVLTKSSGEKFLPLVSLLYTDILCFDVLRLREVNKSNKTWYYQRRLDSRTSSFHISKEIWKYLDAKYVSKDKDKDEVEVDFNQLMAEIKNAGLMTEYAGFDPGIRVGFSDVASKVKLVSSLVEIESDEDFVFVLSNLLKKPCFFANTPEGSFDSQILKRIEKIDAERFAEGKPLLVSYSDINGVHPVVHINTGACGYKEYDVREGKVTPAVSKLIDMKLILDYVGRSA